MDSNAAVKKVSQLVDEWMLVSIRGTQPVTPISELTKKLQDHVETCIAEAYEDGAIDATRAIGQAIGGELHRMQRERST